MTKYQRREFLQLSGMGAALGLGFLPGEGRARPLGTRQTSNGTGPDLVLLNGRVYTVDDARLRAEAFAVRTGRFVAVGSSDEIRSLVASGTEVIDAEGMTVTPGFIDTHCHPSGVNELYGVNMDLRSLAEIQEALRRKAAATAPGNWVNGFKFDDTKVRDGRLHRRHLDEAVPEPSGERGASRRTHDLVQQQGVRAGRDHARYARPARWPFRAGRGWGS